MSDISERKKTEKALHDSEERFRSIFQIVPVSIWEEDWTSVIAMVNDVQETGVEDFALHLKEHPAFVTEALRKVKILDVNNATLAIFKARSKDDLLSSLETVFATPDTLPGFEAELCALAAGKEVFETEMSLRTVDKELIHVWLSMRFPPAGSRSGTVLVSLMDISLRKEAEEQVHRLNDALERRIRQRTAQLESANKELEAFAYSVSHDLRTPLRGIDGFCQALLEDHHHRLDDEGQALLTRVRNASQRMGRLIDDMLNLSRVSRSEMHTQRVDLSRMASEIAEELRRMEPDRDVQFVIASDVTALLDETLARVLLQNLIGNAWKFTSLRPRARIEFGTTQVDGRRCYYIRDDGAGFEMQYAHKLFGAFQRLHSADEFPGTGIGLATVQRILHRHGGTVWAEGETGKGATFFFSL